MCEVCIAVPDSISPESCLFDEGVAAYTSDPDYADIIDYMRAPNDAALGNLSRTKRDRIHRYTLDGDLFVYLIDQLDAPRTMIADENNLRARILYEYHDALAKGRLDRKKTYVASVSSFFWPQMYKRVRNWIRSCAIRQ